jgi:hypothetical protein
VPPQAGQVSMSMAKTRLRRCIHWTGSPGAAEHGDVRERPTHRRPGFVAVVPGRGVPRYDAFAVFEVGCEYMRDGFAPLLLTLGVRRAVALACAVKSRQIQPGSGHQGGESGDGRSCASPGNCSFVALPPASLQSCARGIPFILNIKSRGSNTTWVEPSRNEAPLPQQA